MAPLQFPVHRTLIMIFDPLGASGLLFISGVSITLSYRNRLSKINTSKDYTSRRVRNSYFIRAFIILVIALIYNSLIAIALRDPVWIWTWFVLLNAAISMIITWPLYKTSKITRIIYWKIKMRIKIVKVIFLDFFECAFVFEVHFWFFPC